MWSEGDRLPNVEAHTLDGRAVHTGEFGQRQAVALIVIGPREAAVSPWRNWLDDLGALRPEFASLETVVAVSHDLVEGCEFPTALVADRWGEIMHLRRLVVAGDRVEPSPADIVEWARNVHYRC